MMQAHVRTNGGMTTMTLHDALATLLEPNGRIKDSKSLATFASLLQSQTDLNARQLMLTVLTLSRDDIKAEAVCGKVLDTLSAWVHDIAEKKETYLDAASRGTMVDTVVSCLAQLPVDINALKRTDIGKTLNKLSKTNNVEVLGPRAAEVSAACKSLVEEWRKLVSATTQDKTKMNGAQKRKPGETNGVHAEAPVKKVKPDTPATTNDLQEQTHHSVSMQTSPESVIPPPSATSSELPLLSVQVTANGSGNTATTGAGIDLGISVNGAAESTRPPDVAQGPASIPVVGHVTQDSNIRNNEPSISQFVTIQVPYEPARTSGYTNLPSDVDMAINTEQNVSTTTLEASQPINMVIPTQQQARSVTPEPVPNSTTPASAVPGELSAAGAAASAFGVAKPRVGVRSGGFQLGLGRLGDASRLGSLRGPGAGRLGSLRGNALGPSGAAEQIAVSEQRAAVLFSANPTAMGVAGVGAAPPIVTLPSSSARTPAAQRAALAAQNAELAVEAVAEGVEGSSKKKGKRVRWPDSDANLQHVRWFRKDDPPCHAARDVVGAFTRTGTQGFLHAPGFMSAARREHESERAALTAQHAEEEREKAAMLDRLKLMQPDFPVWHEPPFIPIDKIWNVCAGEESLEKHQIAISNQQRPAISYPSQSHVPPSPAEPPAHAVDTHADPNYVPPRIPLVAPGAPSAATPAAPAVAPMSQRAQHGVASGAAVGPAAQSHAAAAPVAGQPPVILASSAGTPPLLGPPLIIDASQAALLSNPAALLSLLGLAPPSILPASQATVAAATLPGSARTLLLAPTQAGLVGPTQPAAQQAPGIAPSAGAHNSQFATNTAPQQSSSLPAAATSVSEPVSGKAFDLVTLLGQLDQPSTGSKKDSDNSVQKGAQTQADAKAQQGRPSQAPASQGAVTEAKNTGGAPTAPTDHNDLLAKALAALTGPGPNTTTQPTPSTTTPSMQAPGVSHTKGPATHNQHDNLKAPEDSRKPSAAAEPGLGGQLSQLLAALAPNLGSSTGGDAKPGVTGQSTGSQASTGVLPASTPAAVAATSVLHGAPVAAAATTAGTAQTTPTFSLPLAPRAASAVNPGQASTYGFSSSQPSTTQPMQRGEGGSYRGHPRSTHDAPRTGSVHGHSTGIPHPAAARAGHEHGQAFGWSSASSSRGSSSRERSHSGNAPCGRDQEGPRDQRGYDSHDSWEESNGSGCRGGGYRGGRGGRGSRLCAFFTTPQGCRKGNTCDFLHMTPDEAVSAGLMTSEEAADEVSHQNRRGVRAGRGRNRGARY